MSKDVTNYAINFGYNYHQARLFVAMFYCDSQEEQKNWLDNIQRQEQENDTIAFRIEHNEIVCYNPYYDDSNQNYGQDININLSTDRTFRMWIGQDDYEVTIEKHGKVVKVGCQTIPFEDVKAIYDQMVKQQK